MSDQARISSIDALESFRADLIQYIAKARAALDAPAFEVRRTKTWLSTEQLNHWVGQVRKRTKLLEQAEQELYSANLTSPDAANALRKMNVRKATRHLAEAQDKLRVIQQWRKRIDQLADPLLRDLEPLSRIVSQVLPKGAVSLGESIKSLQAYAEIRPVPPNPITGAE
jgi:division protein CdvB (Snf7/Vps24/ESCRT-III family)